MKTFLFIFIGGGFGSIARYSLNLLLATNRISTLPLATLTANCLSSFILGLVISLGASKIPLSDPVKLLITVGFCGGFSTFSTFTAESFQLMKDGNFMSLTTHILLNVVLSMLFLVAGLYAGREVS
jgi:fluoride exporter